MKKLLAGVLVAFTLFVPFVASGQDMAGVQHKIKYTRFDPPARIPDKIEPNESCNYSTELLFTITAIYGHSFRYLFDENTTAISVVLAWEQNTADEPNSDLKTALKNLADDLVAHRLDSDYKKLSFGNMIEKRLIGKPPTQGGLPTRLNSKIDNLVGKGFAFPLFNSYPGDPNKVKSVLGKLTDFVGVHESNTKGGFGNLTWSDLFYTKAHDGSSDLQSLFSMDKIAHYIQRMQGDVLPIPEYDCPSTQADNNKRCCNDTNHTSYFRKCGDAGSGNCLQCGSYCCLAGVTWWGPHDLSAHTSP